MRVLAISSAYGGAACALVAEDTLLGHLRIGEEHGLAAALPARVARMLAGAAPPDLVAVVVGPGSFTGLRAGISLAAGLALGWGVPAIGVGVAEALAEAFAGTLPGLDGRCLWTAIQARRGRIFLGWDGRLWGVATDALPIAQGRIAVCGNAANLVAGTLAARGTDVMLTAARAPDPIDVARLAVRRMRGEMPPLDAAPLYVDAPEAKRPEAPRGPPQ